MNVSYHQRIQRLIKCSTVILILAWTAAAQAITFSDNQCAVVIASRQTMAEVIDYVKTHQINPKKVTVYPSENGWLAISVGLISDRKILATWKEQGKIPPDSFCSSGEKFLRGTSLLPQKDIIKNEPLPFSEQQCALIIAARKTLDEVKIFAAESDLPLNKITVYPTRNGWYAVSVALIDIANEKSLLAKLKNNGKIPSDSYCTAGKYLKTAIDIVKQPKAIKPTQSPVKKIPPQKPPKYAFQGRFSDGLALIKQGELWGFINQNDKAVISPQYEEATAFYNAVAIVKQSGKFALIDTSGKTITPFVYTYLQRLADGLYLVKKDQQVGLINADAEVVLPIRYDYIESVENGHIFAVLKGKRYLLKKVDNYQQNDIYDYIGSFREGLAVVAKDNRWGYINKQGDVVIKPQFAFAAAFHDGLARVKKSGLYGYIDHRGELVIAAKYNYAEDFSHGQAKVEQAGKLLIIKKNQSN